MSSSICQKLDEAT